MIHQPLDSPVRFGDFELDLQSGELTKFGIRVRLPGQSLKILATLLERERRIVTREELRKALWPNDTFVDFEHSVNSAVKRLRDALGDSAEHPRFIETLPRLGYRYCGPPVTHAPSGDTEPTFTATAPAAASIHNSANPEATHVAEPPVQEPSPPADKVPAVLPRAPRRPVVRVLLACLLLIVAVFGLNVGGLRRRLTRAIHPLPSPPVPVVTAIRLRPSIAVIGFRNVSGRPDEAWLSTAFEEMLTTELGAGGELRIVPEEDISRAKSDLDLHEAESLSKETLARIRRNLGPDRVVVGSYTALGKNSGGQVRLDLRLQDATSGETIALFSASGTEARLFQIVSQAGAQARQRLGLSPVSPENTATVLGALPQNPEAARLYSEGLIHLRRFDHQAAKDLFQRAVEIEPDFALAHAELSVTWRLLGYDQESMREGKRAFELSANLPEEQRLLAEAQYREAFRDWDHAVDISRTLSQSYPDNLDYALLLARAQTRAGKGHDAVVSLQTVKKMSPPLGDDPRIDLAEALAAESFADYHLQLAAGRRAEEKGRSQGARLLVARGLQHQCEAMSALGKLQESLEKCGQAQRIYAEVGDLHSLAQVLTYAAIALDDGGDFINARTKYDQALAIFRRVGDRAGTADGLNNVAILLGEQGDLLGAKRTYEQALAIYRGIGNKASIGAISGNLGNLLRKLGDLSAAQARFDEAIAMEREIGDQYTLTEWLDGSAQLLFARGNPAGAGKFLEQADAIVREIGNNERKAAILVTWGTLFAAQDDLAGAKSKLEQALKIHTEMGAKKEAAVDQLELADVALEQGHPGLVVEPCRVAEEFFSSQKDPDDEARARSIVVKALLAQGKSTEARKEWEFLTRYAKASQNRQNALQVAIVAAQLQGGSGSSGHGDAIRALNAAGAEARKHGFATRELEARILADSLEAQSTNSAHARARLAAVEKDAVSKGLALLARKAHAAPPVAPAAPTAPTAQ